MKLNFSYLGLLIVIVFSFFTIKPLFINGFFPIHDDTQVARVFEMGKMLKEGTFPVRWVPDLGYGYGYPIFNFYAPLAYYVGGIFVVLGFDALIATKIMIGVGVVLAGFFMYLFARRFWGEIGGATAAIFYIYAPYHAVQIFVRGSVGELWGYAFIPLLFYGLHNAVYQKKWRWVVTGAVGFAGIVLSHNLTAMMLLPFLGIVALFSFWVEYKNKHFYNIRFGLYAVLLGLFLSAFYWMPAIAEIGYTNVSSQIGGGADFRDHFVCMQQLWESNWGYGGSIPGCIDGLSFKVGKLHLIFSLLTFIGAFVFLKKEKHKTQAIILSTFLLLLSIFFTLQISIIIWEKIGVMAYIQYPWRFLTFVSFFSSFLAGALVFILLKVLKNNTLSFVSVGIIFIAVFFLYGKYFRPQTILLKTTQDYTNEKVLKWTTSKISDEYLPKNVKLPASYSDIPKINTNKKTVAITVENQKNLFLRYKNQLPRLEFEQTYIEKIANVLSAIGIGLLITGIIYVRKK